MSHNDLGAPRQITPSDSVIIDPPFRYIQAGVSGAITVTSSNGIDVTLSSALIDKVAIVPTGEANKVLATGTGATDIYVWS